MHEQIERGAPSRRSPIGLMSRMMFGLGLFALAACGSQPTAPAAEAPTTAPVAAAPTAAPAAAPASSNGEPVTIRWIIWSDDIANEKNLNAEIQTYNDSQSEVKVEVIGAPWNDYTPKLQALLAANQLPDIVSIQSEAEFVARKFVTPLDDVMKQDTSFDVNKFLPGAITPAYDGKTYGLRHDSAAWLLFYNKDLFDKAGVPYPSASGWTVDQTMDAACKLSDPAATQWGISNINYAMDLQIQGRNLPWMSMVDGVPQFQANDPQTLAYYQKLADFINVQNCQPNADQNQSLGGSNAFLAGRTAMAIDGNWAFGNVKDNAQFNWGVAPFPGLRQSNFGMKIGIGATSTKQEAAWKFLKWLTYEPEATRFRAEKGMGMPAINDEQAITTFLTGASSPKELPDVYKVLTDPANTYATLDVPGMSEANNLLNPAVDEVIQGLTPATDVVPAAVEKVNEVLAKEWKRVNGE